MAQGDQTLHTIITLLKSEFNPSRLYLFGSRATGTARGESDFDFVMVIPLFAGDRMKNWERCQEIVRRECGVAVDVFTYSEAEFQKLNSEFSSIPETATSTGREIDLGAF